MSSQVFILVHSPENMRHINYVSEELFHKTSVFVPNYNRRTLSPCFTVSTKKVWYPVGGDKAYIKYSGSL